MKIRSISTLLGTIVLASTIASCTDDDNKITINTTNECIITSAIMGKLNRTMHTKDSKGEDSTFVVTVTGNLYPMNIDQERLRIYNTDSLPYGTDSKHVTFSALHSIGAITLISQTTGKDTIFNLNDSIDFSTPRNFRVHATDGVSKRVYQISVNVHQEIGDSTVWHQVEKQNATIAKLRNTRSFAVGKQLYLFGEQDGQPTLLTAQTNDFLDGNKGQWTVSTLETAVKPNSIVRFHDCFYALNAENKVIFSTDGTRWTAVASEETFTSLVTAGSQHLIAIKNGQFYSSTDAMAWQLDSNDTPDQIPTEQLTGTYLTSKMDKTFETLIVVGKCNGKIVSWRREIDLTGGETFPWVLLPSEADDNPYSLPQLQQPILNRYDGASMLTGFTSNGQFAPLYMSYDNGRTWKTSEIKTPAAQAQNALAVTIDENNFVWMFCGNSGEIWRGRINRLGWTPIEGSFEKSNHLK